VLVHSGTNDATKPVTPGGRTAVNEVMSRT